MNNILKAKLKSMNNARLVLAVIRLNAMADAPFNDPVYTGAMPKQYAISRARLLAYKGMEGAK
jgi:hypothetical protein